LKKKDPEQIGAVVNKILRECGWNEGLQQSPPLIDWQDLVGSNIAEQSQPESLKDGVLYVRVENSVWLNHLRFLSEELRQKLNKKLPSLPIKEIRFRQGPLDSAQPPPSPAARTKPARISRLRSGPIPPLSSEHQKLLDEIEDAELRRVLESLLRKQQQWSDT
jgi:predicted nucleic acid-binding Zn ribbon protein